MVLTLAAVLLVAQQLPGRPRFERTSPLTSISPVYLDSYETGLGLAQERALHERLQARILWIDATANISRYNTEEKIATLVKKIRSVGFNTIVFDIKPISGQVVYPSKLAPKLADWRGAHLPEDFDPLAVFVRETKKQKLSLLVSLNAFSEGHRLLRVGPGYEKRDQQTIIYDSEPVLRTDDGQFFPLTKGGTPNGKVIIAVDSSNPVQLADAAGVMITTDRNGWPVSTLEVAGSVEGDTHRSATLKPGEELFYGVGAGAEFLRSQARTGKRLRIDSQEHFDPISASNDSQYPLMMDPNDPNVREYELGIAREVVSHYAVDGLIYDDRLRYAGLDADFSETTRKAFEKVVGRSLSWPDDVFRYTYTPQLVRGIKPGPYYDQWITWRASVIKQFVTDVRNEITKIRPDIELGVYAGSWYGEYPSLGHNYASPDTDAGFWFSTPAYAKTGTAPLFDYLIAGCYYTTATIYDALGKNSGIGTTVEGAATMVNRLVRDQCWTYAGISLSDFGGDPGGLLAVLQAAVGSCQGVMVFDLSHNIEPMWRVFAEAFALPASPPHSHAEILREVRKERASLDEIGVRAPRVIINAGAAGVGQ